MKKKQTLVQKPVLPDIFKVKLDSLSVDRLKRFAKSCHKRPEESIASIVADVLEDDEMAHALVH